MAHTPGPWRFLEEGDTESEFNASRPLTIGDPDDNDLAQVYSCHDSTVSIERLEAIDNARLIAAAPDLLTAVREQHKAIDLLFGMLIARNGNPLAPSGFPLFLPSKSGQPWDAMEAGLAAIAKAEGR